jgi:hypothetical protein
MGETITPTSLAGHLGQTIRHFDALSPGMPSRHLPVLEVEPVSLRVDKAIRVFAEAENLFGIRVKGQAQAGTTIAAVPHTIARVNPDRFTKRAAKVYERSDIVLPDGVISAPLHLVVWWALTKEDGVATTNSRRCDLLGLAKLPDEQKKHFFELISDQTARAVRLLRVLRHPQSYPYSIEISGVFGHSTEDERKRTGLSRGPQSGPEGHLNVVLFPYKEIYAAARVREVLQEEKLKQIGPWDTLIFDRLSGALQTVMIKRVRTTLRGETGFSMSAAKDYGRRPDNKAVPFFEGFRMEFDEEIELPQALRVVTDIAGNFEQLYQGLINFYKAFHKAWGNEAKRDEIEDRLVEYIGEFGFDKESTEEILNLFKTIQPTYGQVRKWINEINQLQVKDEYAEANVRRLERRKVIYERRNETTSAGEVPDRFIRAYQTWYGVSEEQARLLYRLIGDRFKDPAREYKDVWFTWPRHISGTYMFERYSIKTDGRIAVKTLSIAPRLATTKGVAEDLLGLVTRRMMAP